MLLSKIACPHCQKILRSAQAVPLGKKIKCLKCGTPFVVTEEEVRRAEALDAAAPPSPPAAADTRPAAPPPTGPAPWYYAHPGQPPSGPCTWEELKQLVAAGKLQGQDLVWREGTAERRTVGQIPAFAALQPPLVTIARDPSVDFGVTLEEPPPPPPAPVAPPPAGQAAPAAAAAPSQAPPPRSRGFLSWLHATLPKPVLFGLYGALGGLLGVLLLGELFWAVLHPAPPVVEPLTLAVSPGIRVYPASQNTLTVKIARNGFEGPVRVEAGGLPRGVEIPAITIAAEQTEADLQLKADAQAAPGSHEVRVRATGPKADKVHAAETVQLTVEPPPPTLQMTLSHAVTVYAGHTNQLPVFIARQRFPGPVRIEALDIPKDVTISLETLAEKAAQGVLTITAAKGAKPGAHRLQVEARSLVNHKISAREDLLLRVEPPPGKLRMTVSSQVTVFSGDRNRFTVRIARHEFKAPVEVRAEGLPAGVEIPAVTIPPDKTEAVMEVKAAKVALGPKRHSAHELFVRAKALTAEEIADIRPLQLRIEPHPGKLRMTVSSPVSVFPGDENTFTVRIARGEFQAPVRVEAEGVPAGVEIPAVTIPPDKSEAVMAVKAKNLGPETRLAQKVRVVAKALTTEDITDEGHLQLRVEPPPPAVRLAVPREVPLYPGGEARFSVKIERHRFVGPVQIDGPAPGQKIAGVISLTSLSLPADRSEGEMKLTADAAAFFRLRARALPLQVTARGADGKGPAIVETLTVKLLTPPSSLQLTVSEKVEVHQGGKCQFTVKVARGFFAGPIQVQFTGMPSGVTLPPVTLQVNESQKVVDGRALIRSPVGEHKIQVQATALAAAADGKTPRADKEFTLHVKRLDPSKRPPPLDVVFVLDVTDSMDPQIKGVRDGVQQFIKGLTDNEMEARVGLVAFRDIEYDKEPFKLLQFGGKAFTSDYQVFRDEVGKLKADGGGDEPESSLDALKMAAELQDFRAGARRVLILITDAAYQTKGNAVTMDKALKALKAGGIDQVHLIVKAKHLNPFQAHTKNFVPGYREIHKVTKGAFFDLDKATKGAGKGFADLLPVLSDEIASTIVAAEPGKPAAPPPPPPPPPPAPQLPPVAPPKLAPAPPPTPVRVELPQAATPPDKAPTPELPPPPPEGAAKSPRPTDPQPPRAAEVTPPRAEVPTLQGVQSTQVFADKDRLALLIAIALWTAALAGGIALTLVGAQKRYLRQAWPSLDEALKAVGAGLLAGLLAGAIGQWFFQSTSGTAWWGALSRLLAWAILGGLIGAGMGFFVPNLKWQRAFVGGCIGGFLGALGFVAVSLMADATLGRWLGAAILGLCIGLMVALAEIASRRYWLEVRYGAREVRIVTLGAATVALGGDESVAGVYIPGAAPKALGYRVDKNRVFAEDFATGKTAEAPPGDLRTLEGVRIKVCTAASARATGVSLQLVVVRDVPLMEGMPLTSEDIPGLEPQKADGIVALVSPRPNDPKVFLLRNRSKQPWTVTEPGGAQRQIDPGLGIELSSPCQIDFGQVKATLGPTQGAAGPQPPAGERGAT